jgi:hypothetical protein
MSVTMIMNGCFPIVDHVLSSLDPLLFFSILIGIIIIV